MSNPVQIVETNELWDDEIEKFAHLIVEQLVVLVENHAQQYHQPTWAFEIVEDIKEQFGATHE